MKKSEIISWNKKTKGSAIDPIYLENPLQEFNQQSDRYQYKPEEMPDQTQQQSKHLTFLLYLLFFYLSVSSIQFFYIQLYFFPVLPVGETVFVAFAIFAKLIFDLGIRGNSLAETT